VERRGELIGSAAASSPERAAPSARWSRPPSALRSRSPVPSIGGNTDRTKGHRSRPPAAGGGARQIAAQRRQRQCLVLVAPEVIEHVIVRVERGAERLHRQREDLLGVVQPVAGLQGGVRREGGGHRCWSGGIVSLARGPKLLVTP